MLLALALTAAAADPDCKNALVQSDLNKCAWIDYQRADSEMNAQWKVTLAALRKLDAGSPDGFGPARAEVLLDSQRTWLAFRDAQCELESQSARGGSMQTMLVAICKTTMTVERTHALREAIEGN